MAGLFVVNNYRQFDNNYLFGSLSFTGGSVGAVSE